MIRPSLLYSTVIIFSFLALPSQAQLANDPAALERMERLERDIMLLQKQVARGETPSAPIGEGEVAAVGGGASLEVRLSGMEDEMRKLRGKVEEVEFQNKRQAELFEKFQKDTEFRFTELGGAKPAAAGTTTTPETPAATTERKPIPKNDVPDGPTTAGDGILRATPETPAGSDTFATPREHYNHAFRLLNQTKYEEAAKSFDAFTKQYPKDPLVGNAYYWQGETYYIRRDYVGAADSFRQGFEALPNGPKAPDNLLKLAMSLDALKRDKEACVVLGQVVGKYKKGFPNVADKAEQEQKRIGCR